MYMDNPQGRSVGEALNFVAIDSIPDRPGQELRNMLIDRFYVDGRPEQTNYHLQTILTTTEVSLGIQSDATSSRTQLTLTAKYTLLDNSGKTILFGVSRAVVTYSILDAQYGTLIARDDAVSRGLGQIAEEITNRLGAELHKQMDENDAAPAGDAPAP